MWRRVAGQVSENTRHVVSDGEEEDDFEPVTYDNSCSERLISLYAQKKEKGEIAAPPEFIPSQVVHVDTQKGNQILLEPEAEVTIPPLSPVASEDTQKGNTFEEPEVQNSSEDDIEMEHEYGGFRSFLPRKEQQLHSAVESSFSLSNHVLDVEHENGVWSAIAKEANSLVCLQEKKSSSLAQQKEKRLQKGRIKRKHKLSFNFQSRNKDCCAVNAMKGEITESSASIIISSREPSFVDPFEELLDDIIEHEACHLPTVLSHFPTVFNERENILISDRIEAFEEQTALRVSKMKGDERKPASPCSKASRLGNRVLDDQECLEFSGSDSSTGEANFENRNQIVVATAEVKDRAMVDIFQEAFSDIVGDSEIAPYKPKGIGFYEQLQHVIQREKESQTRFLMNLQTGESSQDEFSRVYVKILSRTFDGKLTVCRCLLGNKIELLNCRSLEGMEKIVIFQPKICGSVELEAGNLIHIHPPWQES